jgi:omega-amidase
MRFQLGICQMRVATRKTVNLEKAEALVVQARGAGADIAVLPEMFNCPYGQEYFAEYAETAPDGETFRCMAKLAREERIYIIAGSIPERDRGRIYNSAFVFDREGEIIARHRKAHLFDVEIPGQIHFKESAVLSAGDRHTVFATDLGRFGLAIGFPNGFV